MVKRKICIFTGTRAEYGLLVPLIKELKKDTAITLQIIASGTHVASEFGLTYCEIEKDGFRIDRKINILNKSDTSSGLAKSISTGITLFTKALQELKPDILVVLGDRYEALTVSICAMILNIPIAHLYGGEATYGLIDEAIRHSITKMSHLHFTSTKEYHDRVIQLGEQPNRVFNVGALGVENIGEIELLSKSELENGLGLKFGKFNLLITFHPETLESNQSGTDFQNLLKALDKLKETYLIFTKANADTEGRLINTMIDIYVARHHRAKAFFSMGQKNYLSVMQYVDAVVGNSSSGIIEAPSFKIGTINIGDRQAGRIRASSVIDCLPTVKSINIAFQTLYSKRFQQRLKKIKNPYSGENTAEKIAKILRSYKLTNILKKQFFDIH